MRLSHPIFQGPLEPSIELVTVDTPEGYRRYADGVDLPDTLPGWKVHEGEFPDVDVGLVSNPYGFEDSPDAEWIASGVNAKGPRSMALGRQGNLFHWGFYGDPTRLTPSAQRVFLNTIVYMQGFEGVTPLVGDEAPAREYVRQYIHRVRLAQAEGVELKNYYLSRFPEEVREATGMDPDRLLAYYEENLEFLRADDRGVLGVDDGLRRLGISNRRREFLDALVARLSADPDDVLALSLARRYTGRKAGGSAESFLAWERENRPYLFFSDLGGYRWFVDEHAKAAAARPERTGSAREF